MQEIGPVGQGQRVGQWSQPDGQLRNRVILDFLQDVLAIDPMEAEPIACEMEHTINTVALEKFFCFLAFIGTRSGKGKTWLKEFQQFTKTGTEDRTCKDCIKEYLDRNAVSSSCCGT